MPPWLSSGETSLLGLKTAALLLCPDTENREKTLVQGQTSSKMNHFPKASPNTVPLGAMAFTYDLGEHKRSVYNKVG